MNSDYLPNFGNEVRILLTQGTVHKRAIVKS